MQAFQANLITAFWHGRIIMICTISIGIPVSMRQGKNEAMSNLSSGLSIFVLQFLAELPMALIDAVLLNTYHVCCYRLAEKNTKVMGYSGKKTSDLGITNLTVLDIPTLYRSYEIKNIIFIPPAVSYSNNIIAISTLFLQI